jgi:hypothetical protein
MTRRTSGPADIWGQGITFWCRLWQAQIDQSLKFWALWASNLPRPTAADLAAEAEALRKAGTGAERPRRSPRPTPVPKPGNASQTTLH